MNVNALAALAQRTAEDIGHWLEPIEVAMREFGIDSTARQAAFLAQIVHESDGLGQLVENLNYSAQRLTVVWPHHFYLPPDEPGNRHDANACAHHPEALANLIYANRLGNGHEGSGDGWHFRGRGLVQLTGRRLYTEAGEALGIDLVNQPDQLLEPLQAARAAGWYWSHIEGNALADEGTQDAFDRLTVAINGELIGQPHRVALWRHAESLLSAVG